MDINSIKERRKLCTFASFIGLAILVLCLNQLPQSVNILAIRTMSIAMNSTDQPSNHHKEITPKLTSSLGIGRLELSTCVINMPTTTSEKDVLKQSGSMGIGIHSPPAIKNVKISESKDSKCNLFDGKWVYEPEANPPYKVSQCPFLSDQVSCQRNGRPDSEYEKWNWKASECELPRYASLMGQMLEKLRDKRAIIAGDSLNRNQWESLACLLYSSVPSTSAHIDVKDASYKVFKSKDHNCSVEFYWSPFLIQLDTINQGNSTRILRLDKISKFEKKWSGASIMVFNTGHWWVHHGKVKAWDLFLDKRKLVEDMEIQVAFKKAMKTWARWIDRNVESSKTMVFFRGISPEHKGNQRCANVTKPMMDESYVSFFPEPMTEIVRKTIKKMKTPVKYLNITKRDAHPSIYARKQWKQREPEFHRDCSHWCLPGLPDTWNTLLYSMIVFD
ncbi:PC-Esterase, partial [Dillenia turbinata]